MCVIHNRRHGCAGLHALARRWCAVLWLALACCGQASAQYATGGAGAYRDHILWFNWGAVGTAIPGTGTTVTHGFDVAGATLSVSCTLSNIVGVPAHVPDLEVYAPGGYFQDGLDNLYNIGGIDAANTLAVGVKSVDHGASVTFDYACSATLDGVPYALPGLVLADAETSSVYESIHARLPPGARLRLLDRIRGPGCDVRYYVSQDGAGSHVMSAGDGLTQTYPDSCDSEPNPTGVFFVDGASAAQIVLNGGGLQAVALGVMVQGGDRGDAPASYGAAAHLPSEVLTGGDIPVASAPGTDIFTLALAGRVLPAVRLGADVSVDRTAFPDAAGASADTFDDALATPLPVWGGDGSTYALTPACSVAGSTVAGWMDFDFNGQFDAGERTQALCDGAQASLAWTVPVGTSNRAGTTYLRLRIASNAAELVLPTGVAADGEVEDYALDVADMRVSLTQIPANPINGLLQTGLTLTCTNAGAAAVNAMCAVSISVGTVSAMSCSPTVPAAILPAGASIVCTFNYTGTGAPVTFTGSTGAANETNTGNNTVVALSPASIVAADDSLGTLSFLTGGLTPSVLANDQLGGILPAPDQVLITLLGQTGPAGALFSLAPDGRVSVPPNAAIGSHVLSYRLCSVATASLCDDAQAVLNVVGGLVAAPDSASTASGQPVSVAVTANDSFPPGALVTVPAASTAQGGAVTCTPVAPASCTYTPAPGHVGADQFTYSLCAPAPNAAVCAQATVSVTVAPHPVQPVPVVSPWWLAFGLGMSTVWAARRRRLGA